MLLQQFLATRAAIYLQVVVYRITAWNRTTTSRNLSITSTIYHNLQEHLHNLQNRVQTFRNRITRDSSFREMGAAITFNLLVTGQTGQTKLTFKLDFLSNLRLAAFAILAMFLKQCIKHKLQIFQSVCTFT